MRRTFRRYNLLLALVVIPITILLITASLLLQPLDGNMTRIGGYSENYHGWNQPQHSFVEPLFTREDGEYQHYSDVVVFGDSFSMNMRWGWPNFFVNETGLSLQFFHFDQGGVERLLDSAGFRSQPPKLVIVESLESKLKDRFDQGETTCSSAKQYSPPPVSIAPLNVDTIETTRATAVHAFDLDLAADFLGKALPRLIGLNVTDTVHFHLSRGDLFSSKASREIIAYNHALKIRTWGVGVRKNIRCTLQKLQQQIESNGITHFIFMPVPTKLYAYSDFIEDNDFRDLTIIPTVENNSDFHMLRLDHYIKQAIIDGSVDFYLPNDTHWSSYGYHQAAIYLKEYALTNGILR